MCISADTRHQELCAAVSTQQPKLTSFLKYSFAKIILLIDGAEGGDCLGFHRQMDVQNMVTGMSQLYKASNVPFDQKVPKKNGYLKILKSINFVRKKEYKEILRV